MIRYSLVGIERRSSVKCWEFMNCGRVPGGDKVDEYGICPAYPDHGENCAHLEGTYCHGPMEMAFTRKSAYCMMCEFYRSEHHEKGAPIESESGDS
jgi:hypothetical protein